MKAVVVYESLWGNTAAVARAVAEGIGEGAVALPTKDAGADELTGADLIVAGGPVFAFHLSSERSRHDIAEHPEPGAPDPDLTGPSIREWLDALPAGSAAFASFDTEVRGPFGKGAPTIAKELEAKGYRRVAKPEGFIVQGKYGPLKDGELDRARRWGASLRAALSPTV
ncbi:flavodoxin family protein [Tessaracoccus sp. MC1627]|uniref:flavodoxin family protein n=1 Tax=Tessaracoccus sp. MC1627 TaxID=2760312 RepID=UPI00160021CC|nr:flavodoxin family protein [Tessaracoccus sp. MC1627]MBB1511276.1 flavodoxin family protein [Tessaracoccus sp. MC1627]